MLKRLVLSAIFLSCGEVFAQSGVLERIAEDKDLRLEWVAGPSVEDQLSIQICPHATCDRFVSSDPNLESFVRFLDVYLVFASGYVWLSDLGRDVPLMPYIQERLPNVVASEVVLPNCGMQLTIETISCSLNTLAESLEIEKYFVRGSYSRIEDSWRQRELSPENIALNLSTSAGYGVSLPELGITLGAPRYWESRREGVADEFRQFMRRRVAEAGLPQPTDVTSGVARGQEINISESYRIEPTRLEELPCWADRSCDYPNYEGTARLAALTSEASGELIGFELSIGGTPVAPDMIERYGNLGVFDLEGVTITHNPTYLPMPLWGDTVATISTPTVSVDGLLVSDAWCESGWFSLHVEVTLGPRGGRGVSGECLGSRSVAVSSQD
jgi:hypothetical protein